MGRLAAIALLLLAAQSDKPHLVVRAHPRLSIAPLGIGCAEVLFTAEIRGPETEGWYCPKVEWTWPDGTTSATESDCPPFEARDRCVEPQAGCGLLGWSRQPDGLIAETRKDCPCTIVGFPRRWTRRVCVPAHPNGGEWEIAVRLYVRGETVATQRVTLWVK